MVLRVTSSNIRFDNPKDGKHDWNGRRQILADAINKFSPDILGTQEGWEPQLKDFESLLSNLKIVDSHREWITDRMYPSLFVNPDKYKVIKSGDIWLSETPYTPATKSFGSAFPRLCTWAILKEFSNEKEIFVIDVHLDHLETKTRQEQIKVLLKETALKNPDKLPTILMGDFNESPSEGVRNIIDSNSKLQDPWIGFSLPEEGSHHGFEKRKDATRIDWILAEESFNPTSIELYKDSDNGIYPSDHYPVFAVFDF